jgi:type IV pilus assembly protein PilE
MSKVQHVMRGDARGFTLLELMITVAIVGILAAIALPSYMDYVTRGKLTDGVTKLADAKSKMDKYFFDNRQYLDPTDTTCGVTFPTVAGKDDYFLIDTPVCTATTYTLRATGVPANGLSSSFVYRVTQANAKSSVGPAGWTSAATCWAVRKDGSCQ